MLYIPDGKTLLLDGATGTQLMARGLIGCPELWNIEHPDIVRDVAKSYFDAGSDAVETNTFGGSSVRLKRYGLADRAYELNRAGAELAVSVRPEGRFVIASVGPTGQAFSRREFSEDLKTGLAEAYTNQISGLHDAGVDAVLFETFDDLREMDCAITALKIVSEKNGSDLPYLCSMKFDNTPRGFYTLGGVTVEKFVMEMKNRDVFAIGSNCNGGMHHMAELMKEFRHQSDYVKLLAQPNGEYRDKEGHVILETPKFFAGHLSLLLDYSVSIVGGCCGTTPEHIMAMRKVLDRNNLNYK